MIEYAVRFKNDSQPDMSGKTHYNYVGHTFSHKRVLKSFSIMKRRHPDAVIVTRTISTWEEV